MTAFYPGWADREPIPEGDDVEQRVRARGGKPFGFVPRLNNDKARRGGRLGRKSQRLEAALDEGNEE